jgi:hypothetical protein
MPIVITPQGEYIDSVTGNPVGIPPQRTGAELTVEELQSDLAKTRGLLDGAMARENVPANLDMGMNSMMPQVDEKTLVEIDFLMKEFNLSMDEAIEAVARTRDTGVRPEEFSGQQQAPMQPQMPMARPTMPSSRIGALPSAPPPRPDMSGLSREQMDLLRRGIDPFAEGMVR